MGTVDRHSEGAASGQFDMQVCSLGTLWGGCLSWSLGNGAATHTWRGQVCGAGAGEPRGGGAARVPSLTGPDIVDIKPANMEDLTEVITASEFHPHHCNLFVYSSSKGSLRLCDMRAAALCDKHAKRECGVACVPSARAGRGELCVAWAEGCGREGGRSPCRGSLEKPRWTPGWDGRGGETGPVLGVPGGLSCQASPGGLWAMETPSFGFCFG